jgi:predicted lipoprotein
MLLFSKFYRKIVKDKSMKIKTSTIVIIILAVLLVFLAARYGFTVVSIEEASKTVEEEAFDPQAYVEGIWDSQLMPAFQDGAVELSTIFSEMKVDADGKAPKEDLIGVAEKYGLITVGEAHVYMVKGTGTIVNVNTESSIGTAEIALDGYDGMIKALLYIGTRIPSDESSVRDAVGFISFGDFKEQTEYGKVASQINKHVLTTVLEPLDRENLVGKTISFKGSFTIRTFNLVQIDVSEILIVPVEIEVEGN